MKVNLTSYEKRNYVMNDKRDFIILNKIKELEKKKLDTKDKEIIRLIRTQLEKDWRSPLIIFLNKLLRRNKK